MWDQLWLNANLLTDASAQGLSVQTQAALAIEGEQIAWVGAVADLPGQPEKLATQVHDVSDQWITPGLIDCHTHLVYAGNRSHEFEQRLQGQSYAEIAKAGGGIQFTVQQTRAASAEDLYQQSAARLQACLANGVTTLEIKSGYGLSLESERKLLQVARRLGEDFPVTVRTTFLGAHTLPPEYQDQADHYIELVCETMLPTLADEGLVDMVDVFCEHIAFSPAQTQRVFEAAQALKLPIKCHAEQLSNQGAAKLAAEHHALSADHLEYVAEEGVQAMADADTVAVLLPGAFYYLQASRLPPIELLRKHQVPIAIATDCNPGSSPTTSLPLMMNMSCLLFGLHASEAWAGVTSHAAQALGLQRQIGKLKPNYDADLLFWDFTTPLDLVASLGSQLQPAQIFHQGQLSQE